MTLDDEIQTLRGQLEEAFGDLPVPPDDLIVYDNSGNHMECNQIRRKFRGRHWRELSINDLAGEADSLYFFTHEAYRFFLPAFIEVSLTEPDRADLIPDAILTSLAQPEDSRRSVLLDRPRLQRARAHGISEQLVRALVDANEGPSDDDELRRSRRETLTVQQKEVVRNFILFLKRHRESEFSLGDLNHAEELLAS